MKLILILLIHPAAFSLISNNCSGHSAWEPLEGLFPFGTLSSRGPVWAGTFLVPLCAACPALLLACVLETILLPILSLLLPHSPLSTDVCPCFVAIHLSIVSRVQGPCFVSQCLRPCASASSALTDNWRARCWILVAKFPTEVWSHRSLVFGF